MPELWDTATSFPCLTRFRSSHKTILLIATRRTQPFAPPRVLELSTRSVTPTGRLADSSVSSPHVQSHSALAAALLKSLR